MPAKQRTDWRHTAAQLDRKPGAAVPGGGGGAPPPEALTRTILAAGTRTSRAKRLKGKMVTDLRRDDIMALLERARKAHTGQVDEGLKGLFGGGK